MDYLDKIIQKEMKGSIIIVFVFLCGVAMGILNIFPSVVSDSLFSTIVLYVLMFLVGVCIGSENKIKSIIKNVTFHSLLIPFGTIIGTLVFSAIAAIIMDSISLFDCLAIVSGYGYYSLSSILIMQIKTPITGSHIASTIGAIALISNVLRELFTLVFAPIIVRHFGPISLICSGGATTADTTLPIITRYCGNNYVAISIIHGLLVDFSVPFFVTLFAQT